MMKVMKVGIVTGLLGSLAIAVVPALAQTSVTPTTPAPAQEQTTPPMSGMGGKGADSMREMMRDMMQDMMQRGPRDGNEARADRPWRHGWRRWHGDDMDGQPRMGRRGMMHGAAMRIVFAIVDADSNGALSLAEVQDFHKRIFNAVDQNKDGSVDIKEIEGFFHGRGEMDAD